MPVIIGSVWYRKANVPFQYQVVQTSPTKVVVVSLQNTEQYTVSLDAWLERYAPVVPYVPVVF